MIIRFFRAIVHDGQAVAFRTGFPGTVLPMIRSQEGLISASVALRGRFKPALQLAGCLS